VAQWNSSVALTGGWWASGHKGVAMVPMTAHGLLGAHAKMAHKAGGLVDGISQRLLGQTLPAKDRAALLEWLQLKEDDVPPAWKVNPDRLKDLCSLILSGPVGGLR
jgi:hypothetical protein